MKPEKLTIQKMWELYQTLKQGVGNKQEYLIDEIFEMLNRISEDQFLQSLWMMYPKINFAEQNPVEMATLFLRGLKHNQFFMFVDVMQGLEHGNTKR